MTRRYKNKTTRYHEVAPVPDGAFLSREQLLFQRFIVSPKQQRNMLSNAMVFWDCVPRYTISRARMNKMRTPDGHLDVVEIPFHLGRIQYTAVIYPARIRTADGRRVSYYASAREELIEHALRKIASETQAGFFDCAENRSGVRFSLYRLRRELEQHGHSLRYDELVEGLDILSLSAIEIVAQQGTAIEACIRANYLTGLARVRRKDFDSDREARWLAQFHPLVTFGIGQQGYRQYNYLRLMQCRTQIARWLLCQLVVKYRQASPDVIFSMNFSTIMRDSALLDGYGRLRDAVGSVDDAWDELRMLGAISTVRKKERRSSRNKIEDVIYEVVASEPFAAEQKNANFRCNQADGLIQVRPSAAMYKTTAASRLVREGV